LFYLLVSVNCLAELVKRRSGPDLKVLPIENTVDGKAAMQNEQTMLQAEIEFWRYMIESRRGSVSAQATERMLFACELAERRLMTMNKCSSESERRQ
jgi:hypothetical protein